MNVDIRPDRVRLDSELWQRGDIRRALAARDLATVFTLLRRVGTSQRAIATLTGLAPSEVYEISRGRRVMAYDVLCRIADGLGVMQIELPDVLERRQLFQPDVGDLGV